MTKKTDLIILSCILMFGQIYGKVLTSNVGPKPNIFVANFSSEISVVCL